MLNRPIEPKTQNFNQRQNESNKRNGLQIQDNRFTNHPNEQTLREYFHCLDSLGDMARHDGGCHLNSYFD